MQSWVRRWGWAAAVIVVLLLVKAALLGSWLSNKARLEAADAAGVPVAQVEADGLDITLTGFTDPAARDAAVAAVDALESSQRVTGVMADGSSTTVGPSGSVAAGDEDEDGGDGDGGDGSDGAGSAAGDDADGSASGDGSDGAGSAGSGDGSGDEDDAAEAEPTTSVEARFAPDGTLTLEGSVPEEDMRVALIDLAIYHFGTGRVANELHVDPVGLDPEGGELVVTGDATSDRQRSEWLEAAAAIAEETGLEVVADLGVLPVADALNAMFELEPIEFDERQATLRPASQLTLDRAAALINSAPDSGRFRVVGHTDSDGSASRNQQLSQRRAQAVVEYLVEFGEVDRDRLEAVGVGEEQLLISPELTANDKQRNRRIEWEAIS